MKAVKVESTTELFINCPKCGREKFRVDGLFGEQDSTFGPWNCRHCFCSFTGIAHSHGGVEVEFVDTSIKNNVYIPTVVLLKTWHKDDPVYFTIEHWCQEHTIDDFLAGRDSWFTTYFEEHTCPTNFMRVERIYNRGNDDLHGVLIVQDVIKKSTAIEQLRPIVGGQKFNGEPTIDPFDHLELLFPYIVKGGRDKDPIYSRWADQENSTDFADVIHGVNADRVDFTVDVSEGVGVVVYDPSDDSPDYIEWSPIAIYNTDLWRGDDYYLPIGQKNFAKICIIEDREAFFKKIAEKGIDVTEEQYQALLNKLAVNFPKPT